MNEQRFTLDVSKEPAVLPVLYLGQGDKNGTTLVAELYDNGVALSASSYTPSFEMRLPGGKAYYKVDGTLSGNVATIPIDETYAAAVAGMACTAYVSLKSGGNVVSTTRMNVAVLESATNDVNPGQAYENGIEQAIADAESRIASAASSAASQVAQAQAQATTAIAQAQADQQQAADDLNAAIDALGDISEVAVPLMSETTRGGAKLGSGLKVDDGKLSLGDVVTDSHDGPIYSVDAKGWAEQDGTPTPDNPIPIHVVEGRNLLQNTATSQTANGVTFTVNADGSISLSGTATANTALILCQQGVSGVDLSHLKGKTVTLSGGVSSAIRILFYTDSAPAYGDSGNGVTFTVNDVVNTGSTATTTRCYVYINSGTVCNNVEIKPQLEAGAKATPYVPYGHVGLEVRPQIVLYKSNYYINAQGVEAANAGTVIRKARPTGSSMTATCVTNANGAIRYHGYDADGNWVKLLREVAATSAGTWVTSFDVPEEVSEIRMSAYVSFSFELVSVTPIPLPSKGFAASLPDGTADALAVDSAGRWEWTSATDETVFDGTENWSYNANSNFAYTVKPSDGGDFGAGSSSVGKFLLDRFLVAGNSAAGTAYASGTNILFWCGGAYSPTSSAEAKAWAAANPITLLYQLATPTTEHGYIDLPYVPEGSTITIPELEDVGIRCFVDGARELAEHADNWGKRCKENESRIAALEAAIANLATS